MNIIEYLALPIEIPLKIYYSIYYLQSDIKLIIYYDGFTSKTNQTITVLGTVGLIDYIKYIILTRII